MIGFSQSLEFDVFVNIDLSLDVVEVVWVCLFIVMDRYLWIDRYSEFCSRKLSYSLVLFHVFPV